MAGSTPLSAQLEPTAIDIDKLSYEIFSILESRFLFGYGSEADSAKLFLDPHSPLPPPKSSKNPPGKVRILSIDSGAATDGILAARSLALLEDSLRRRSPDARIADYFDVAAGSGAGGVLAALLFTRGDDGRPLVSAADAMRFLVENRCRRPSGMFRRLFARSTTAAEERVYRKAFSEKTMKDTLKTVLIPCYDLASNAPFLFSRADALETDGYDFRLSEVCVATSADPTVVGATPSEMMSVDGRTRIVAVDGGVAMSNPTAAAITHVLNNKQEFPFCGGAEDLLVVSLGNGETGSVKFSRRNPSPTAGEFVRIAGDGVSDMVDQAVSMSFGYCRASNYVRIQANGFRGKKLGNGKCSNSSKAKKMLDFADEILAQKNMESILFQGKRISEKTNAEKLEWFAGELVKEQERRKSSLFPTVALKQATPRTSSATMASSSV